MSKATCIVVDGPFPVQGRHGDESGRYVVFPADDDGEEVGKSEYFSTYAAAVQRGQALAGTKLELVIDASRG